MCGALIVARMLHCIKLGYASLCVVDWQHPSTQELRTRFAVHGPLDRLQTVDLPSACPLLQESSMALLTASMSRRRNLANRLIGPR